MADEKATAIRPKTRTDLASREARSQADAALGVAWWNRITPRQRLTTLRAADTAVPAVAWEWWRRTSAGCEESAHA